MGVVFLCVCCSSFVLRSVLLIGCYCSLCDVCCMVRGVCHVLCVVCCVVCCVFSVLCVVCVHVVFCVWNDGDLCSLVGGWSLLFGV